MTQPIDEVFVEVTADTRDFSRDLKRDTDDAYKKLERATAKVTRFIERSFDDAGNEIEQVFDEAVVTAEVTSKVIERVMDDAADEVADDFERAGERIEDAFREASRVAAVQSAQISHQARQASDEISANGNAIQRTFGRVSETIVALGSALVGLGASAPTPAGLVAILLVVTAIGAAIGPIIALTAALADLVGFIGVLPAAIGVLVTAIAPMVIAFQGFGDAIGAILEKDPEKIKEALEKLSPAARSVAREFQKLLPVFEKLQRTVQQSFFLPLVGSLTNLTRRLLPTLQAGLSSVSRALGRVFGNIADLFAQPDNIAIINRLFQATTKIVNALGPAFTFLIDKFLALVDAGLPFLVRFGKAFSDVLNTFGRFIQRSIDTGAFNDFVEDAVRTFKELVDLTKALGNLFGALFADADDEGRDFIATLTEMINHLAEFLRTPEGMTALQDVVDTAKQVGLAILALGRAIEFVFNAFNFQKHSIEGLLHGLELLGEAFTSLVGVIGDFFSDLFSDVGDFVGEVIDFFKALPGDIIDALKALPGQVADFFKTVFDEAFRAVGRGIGLVLFIVTQLPGQIIAGLDKLKTMIADFFVQAWTNARDKTTQGGNAILTFVRGLPSRIGNFLRSIGPIIANIFRSAMESAKNFVVNGFNAIVNFIRSVPGRIKSAFKAAGSFASDIGAAIGNALKGFINSAIDKINQGISDIDNILPGSLPRIPRLAQGGVINPTPGGIIANLGEGGQREIVSPEKLLREIVGEAGPRIVFEPGSVVVEFNGAVPTEAEAFRTGQTVAAGIANTLARRDIRTTVRTL